MIRHVDAGDIFRIAEILAFTKRTNHSGCCGWNDKKQLASSRCRLFFIARRGRHHSRSVPSSRW